MKKLAITPHETSSSVAFVDIIRITNKAILIGTKVGEYWIPKSALVEIDWRGEGDGDGYLQRPSMIKQWIMDKNPALYDIY